MLEGRIGRIDRSGVGSGPRTAHRLPRILGHRWPLEQVPGQNFTRAAVVGVRESEKYNVRQLPADLLWPDSADYVAVAQQFGIPICHTAPCPTTSIAATTTAVNIAMSKHREPAACLRSLTYPLSYLDFIPQYHRSVTSQRTGDDVLFPYTVVSHPPRLFSSASSAALLGGRSATERSRELAHYEYETRGKCFYNSCLGSMM